METDNSVLLPTIDVENENQIEYASHVHPLTLYEIDGDCSRSLCRKRCLGGSERTYGCYECGLFLHESCTKIEIPQEIDHYFHAHPLRLAIKESKHFYSLCEACDNSLSGLIFTCRDCGFHVDVECGLLPTELKIKHISRFRPFTLCDDEEKIKNNICRGCGGGLSTPPCFSYDSSSLSKGGEFVYEDSHFFLHERCLRLPLKIDSPFHPEHSLELVVFKLNCRGCDRPSVYKWTYQCLGSCRFTLGVECAFLRTPILNFESHNHLLTLFPSINPVHCCQICKEPCDTANIFRCIDCDYNLHLHCGPLPCSIQDKCHIDSDGDPHPLKLMHAFVEDGYEDDTVYCDACEQPRDPDQCVYYCNDCNFFAELKCVEAEVLRSLNGERGNVKLRTANKTRIRVRAKLINNAIIDNVETDSDNDSEDIGTKYLEVKLHEDFFSGFYADEEYEQLVEIFQKARVELLYSRQPISEEDEAFCQKFRAHIKRCHLAQEKLLSKGKHELENSSDEESDNGENELAKQMELHKYYEENDLLEVFFRRDYNIVKIGEHMIVQDSACVLKGLLHKYGDFSAKSKLSERLKAIFLTMFCEIIRSMCLTNVREVDYVVLHKWWKALKLAQHAGFEIQFAIDQLYKVMQALFGMEARSSYNEMRSRVDILSNEIEEDEANLEEKKRELEERKSDVDKHKYAIEFSSSPLLVDCFEQVRKLKWKKAWDGSPIMFR